MLRYILTASLLTIVVGGMFHLATNPLVWTVLFIGSSIFFGAAVSALLWQNGRARTRFRAALAGSLVAVGTGLTQFMIMLLTFSRTVEGDISPAEMLKYDILNLLAVLMRTGLPGAIAAFISAWTINDRRVLYVATVSNGIAFVPVILNLPNRIVYLLTLIIPIIAAAIVARYVQRRDPLRPIGPALVETIPTSVLSSLICVGVITFNVRSIACDDPTFRCLSDEIFRGTTLYIDIIFLLALAAILGSIGGTIGALTVRRYPQP